MNHAYMMRNNPLNAHEMISSVLIVFFYSIFLFYKAEQDGKVRYNEVIEKSKQFTLPYTIYYQNILNMLEDEGKSFFHEYCNNACYENDNFYNDDKYSHHYLYQTGVLDQRDYFF